MSKEKEGKPGQMKKMSLKERIALIAPDGTLSLFVLVIPLVCVVLYSFWTTDLDTFEVLPIWTLDNFASILQPIYLQALGRSLLITLLTVVGTVVLGFPLAYFISRAPGKLQMVLLLLVMVPFWTSFVVRTYAWVSLLGPSGQVNQMLTFLHLIPEGTDLRYTTGAIAIGMIYTYLPLMVLPLYATLEKLDSNLINAASDLGRSMSSAFFTVVVPQAKAGIAAGCMLVAIPALGEYTIPAILGGGKTLMIGNVIANEFMTTGNYSRGAALAALLLLIVLIAIIGSQIASHCREKRGSHEGD